MIGLAVGFVLCLALVAMAFIALARQRRQIATLMARLDAVEAAPADDRPATDETPARPREPAPPGDVLHGQTTYVRAMVEGADSGSRTLADRTILAIHARLDEAISPRQLAAGLNVSLRTLERVLAATLECSPRHLIVTMKMREARRLLLAGNLRVTEVAYRLGFSSPAHFSTRFRTFYGCSPSSFMRAGKAPGRGADDTDALRSTESDDDA